MAISLSITNNRQNHQLITAAIGAVTTWQTITFPSWVRRVQVINFNADDIYLSTDVVDGATGTGGVLVDGNGGTYNFDAGGPDGPFLAVRHASGTYTFGLALWGQ